MNETRLYEILKLKREHDTMGERLSVDNVLMPYAPHIYRDSQCETLAYGVKVPMPDGADSRTLFCAHVDTVHYVPPVPNRDPKLKDFINSFRLNTVDNIVSADGDVLGADDGAGMWLLLEMIDAGVPGMYLFHRGEECGGIGSSGMARHHYDFLAQFDRAIAFDRKATHSIITHQRGGRCCSDAFALALAEHLSCDAYFMAPDDGGTFTDTANYTDDIGECTNVSVGYYNEHTANEKLDLNYLFALRTKCLAIDWEALPTERKPGEADLYNWPRFRRPKGQALNDAYDEGEYTGLTVDDLSTMDFSDMLDLCEADPYTAANLIYQLLWGAPDERASASEAYDRVIHEQGDHFDHGDHGRFVLSFDDDDHYDDIYDRELPYLLKVGLR